MKHTHELTIRNHPYPFLDRIIDGTKTIEGRTDSAMFQRMKVGDNIKLYNHQKWVLCEITALRKYVSFRQMLEKETIERVLPNLSDIESGVKMYHQFPRFIENEKQYGVVAIELKKIEAGT